VTRQFVCKNALSRTDEGHVWLKYQPDIFPEHGDICQCGRWQLQDRGDGVLISIKRHQEGRWWRDFCRACGHDHIMMLRPCPDCGGRGGRTPQPVSNRVLDSCSADYACDGCVAYRDHLR
jgi:hypothetical protein